MSNKNNLLKMARLVELLNKEYKGTAEDLAEILNVSRRTIFRYFEELRDFGAEIRFDKQTNSYYLEKCFCFYENYFKSAL